MFNIENYCTGFQHLGLPTADMDATLSFYKTLGFKFIYETINDGNRVCFLQLGNMVIETYESCDVAAITGALDHISLNVNDIDEVFSWSREIGLKTDDTAVNFLPFFENGVRFFTVVGPNSEKIEFNQIVR